VHAVALDPTHVLGTADQLLVCVWRGLTTAAAMEEVARTAKRMAFESAPFAMVAIFEANAVLPGTRARREMTDLFRSIGDAVSCSAVVFEGHGYRAAAVRGMMRGLSLAARQPFPHEVFDDVPAAATWMAEHGSPVPAALIVSQVGFLRARVR
tara:strand:+ start:340 stop:798 length:459 start_codon:yes stop_codon:yes gene_type:complete